MKYEDITPTMRAFLAGREAFRRLGFPADALYCQVARSAQHQGILSCFVKLIDQGKTFAMEVGPIDDGEDGKAFEAEYETVTKAVNAGEVSMSDLDRLYTEGEAYQNAAGLVAALLNKGFTIPSKGKGKKLS